MFKNTGPKIKILAWIECIAGIILSVIYGLIILISGQIVIALIIIAVGSILFWLTSVPLYAIGQIVENTETILAKLNDSQTQKTASIKSVRQTPSKTSSPHTDSSKTNAKNEDWICSCGARNSGSATSCSTCFKNRE